MLFIDSGNVVVMKKRTDVFRVRPQSRVFGGNAESVSHRPRLPVRHSGQCGDTRDAAACMFLLDDRFHRAITMVS